MLSAQDNTISKMQDILKIYKSEIEEIRVINRGMREHIDSCHK